MKDVILNFPKQLAWEPEVENSQKLAKKHKFIVVGMGGSALAADLLKIAKPDLELVIHRNYGLPALPVLVAKASLVILSGYSGNTEEVIDAFYEAKKRKLKVAAITTGGKLLDLAKKNKIPFVQIPDTGIEPRMATGFVLKALLKLVGDKKNSFRIGRIAHQLRPRNYEKRGKLLAKKLKGFVPIIYASQRNIGIAYNWKIKFNEIAKIPAFANRFPELNHNEMTGFSAAPSTKNLSSKFHFIFLKDGADHQKILKRMAVLEKMYRQRKLPVEMVKLQGRDIWRKIFSGLILADWTAYSLASIYGVEPEAVPMIEEFKKLIK